jgi:hypothetical protein
MIIPRVAIRDKNTGSSAQLKRILKNLENIDIGFPENGKVTAPTRRGSMHKPVTDMPTMALIAMTQEFGSTTIPERPFLRPAIDKNKEKIWRLIERNLVKLVYGEIKQRDATASIGDRVVKYIRDQINMVTSPPLSLSTYIRKLSSKPLIDRRQMINSVQWKKKPKNGSK